MFAFHFGASIQNKGNPVTTTNAMIKPFRVHHLLIHFEPYLLISCKAQFYLETTQMKLNKYICLYLLMPNNWLIVVSNRSSPGRHCDSNVSLVVIEINPETKEIRGNLAQLDARLPANLSIPCRNKLLKSNNLSMREKKYNPMLI